MRLDVLYLNFSSSKLGSPLKMSTKELIFHLECFFSEICNLWFRLRYLQNLPQVCYMPAKRREEDLHLQLWICGQWKDAVCGWVSTLGSIWPCNQETPFPSAKGLQSVGKHCCFVHMFLLQVVLLITVSLCVTVWICSFPGVSLGVIDLGDLQTLTSCRFQISFQSWV